MSIHIEISLVVGQVYFDSMLFKRTVIAIKITLKDVCHCMFLPYWSIHPGLTRATNPTVQAKAVAVSVLPCVKSAYISAFS